MLNKYSAAVTLLILPRMSTCWASHRELPHKEMQTKGHSALLSFRKPTDGSVSLFMKPVSLVTFRGPEIKEGGQGSREHSLYSSITQ